MDQEETLTKGYETEVEHW